MKKSLKALPLMAVAGLGLSVVVPTMAQEGPINVISREDGSGTRGAFVEIVGVVDEDDNDLTTQNATVQNQTSGVMQTVAGDPSAIGYISLGSLDESVKAVKVDGSEATPEAIKAGEYPIARPFNVAWSAEKELSEVAADFLSFIHSQEGQAVVEEEGYISVTPAGEELDAAEEETEEVAEEETEEAAEEETEEAAEEETEEAVEEETEEASEETELAPYEASGEFEGTIEVVGSTSVSPLMEKLAEAYKEVQPNVEINITSNGSSAGMEAAMNDTADLGMASRELKDDEMEALEHDAIAIDGIAVVVNNENPTEEMTLEAIRGIFLGEITTWEDATK
ncbi:substrate-binding domain-containing protein [Facklamia miroungae]|uniref:Phosphate transport system substrate-binding protein n=1 Tax=Facklamia miroungae TaxID=120956 RepID=A0A1G7SFQ5_9LACT|nr:substrate-binding domain-containing protein [Facklamia miroungae]NKZ29668.1 phosphate-binding protein [Facklamia miroungae]SDG21838.1 phosphate transport system substrate-binding protein [Facklamia miroungae]